MRAKWAAFRIGASGCFAQFKGLFLPISLEIVFFATLFRPFPDIEFQKGTAENEFHDAPEHECKSLKRLQKSKGTRKGKRRRLKAPPRTGGIGFAVRLRQAFSFGAASPTLTSSGETSSTLTCSASSSIGAEKAALAWAEEASSSLNEEASSPATGIIT